MPIFIRLVRAAIAVASISGAASTERSGAVCSSASHITSRPIAFGGVHLLEGVGEGFLLGLPRHPLKLVEHTEFHVVALP